MNKHLSTEKLVRECSQNIHDDLSVNEAARQDTKEIDLQTTVSF